MRDHRIESANPYLPTTENLQRSPTADPRQSGSDRMGWRSMSWSLMLWFLPGSVLGLNLGMMFRVGLFRTILRTTRDPDGAARFFLAFRFACLALSLLWRLPRIFWLGNYPLRRIACFVGGCVGATLFVASTDLIEELGLVQTTWMLVLAVCVVGAFSIFAGVEIEVMLGRRFGGVQRDAGNVDGQVGDQESVDESRSSVTV